MDPEISRGDNPLPIWSGHDVPDPFRVIKPCASARRAARMFVICLAAITVLTTPLLATDARSEALSKKIVLSRLANAPDQLVGGEILKVAYAKLDITVEFLDVEAKRALALSSAGDVDGGISALRRSRSYIPRCFSSSRRSTTSSPRCSRPGWSSR